MDAFVKPGIPKPAGIVGSIISLALVCGAGSAFAEGITGISAAADVAPTLASTFSESDLADLEYASAADATTARLAALEEASGVESMSPARSAVSGDVGRPFDGEVFAHSSRLLPLLITVPEAAPSVVNAPVSVRPGSVRPVGVTVSSLRSPTPTERSGR